MTKLEKAVQIEIRYQTVKPYFDKINEKIIVDCMTEYIDDEVKKDENHF